MHKVFATLVLLLCLAVVAGYMADEAQAAPQFAALGASAQLSAAAKSHTTRSTAKPAVKSRKTASAHARAVHKVTVRKGKRGVQTRRVAYVREKPSVGQSLGLNKTADELALASNSALVVDRDSGEVLYQKNPDAVLPIASITKLMTAMVVLDAQLPLDETITIDRDDVDTAKGTRSRLKLGTPMTRQDALHLALMSSENRAAAALGRHYPGGTEAFVEAMNAKARLLGMNDTHYVDANGLSPQNRSSAADLGRLVRNAYDYPLIRELSTSLRHAVQVGNRVMEFHTTNRLLTNEQWQIGLQKTGYISEAGRCMVMEATIQGRHLVLVLLDSWGKYSRIGDAGRIRAWLQSLPTSSSADSNIELAADS